MPPRELMARTEIDARPGCVWGVLIDTARYPHWNPFIVELHGELSAGAAIRFTFRVPPAPRLQVRGTVLEVTQEAELRWAGRLLRPWLFRAEHYHLLEPLDGGRTRFTHGEIFTGALAVIAWPLLRRFARPVYARFNQALSDRIRVLTGAS